MPLPNASKQNPIPAHINVVADTPRKHLRTAVESEARLEALLLAAEEVDNAWYDDEGTVRFHEELWDRLVALRRAHNAFEEWELAGGRLAPFTEEPTDDR